MARHRRHAWRRICRRDHRIRPRSHRVCPALAPPRPAPRLVHPMTAAAATAESTTPARVPVGAARINDTAAESMLLGRELAWRCVGAGGERREQRLGAVRAHPHSMHEGVPGILFFNWTILLHGGHALGFCFFCIDLAWSDASPSCSLFLRVQEICFHFGLSDFFFGQRLQLWHASSNRMRNKKERFVKSEFF